MKLPILLLVLLSLAACATDLMPSAVLTSAPTATLSPSVTEASMPAPTQTPIPFPSLVLMPTQTPVRTPPRIDTQGWKTFESNQYGFRMKYPSTFTYALATGYPDKDRLFQVGFFDAKSKVTDADFRAVGLMVLANPKRLDIDAFVNENTFSASEPPPIVPGEPFIAPTARREVTVAGIRSIRFTHYPMGFAVSVVLVPSPENARVIMIAYDFHPDLEPLFEAMTQTLELQATVPPTAVPTIAPIASPAATTRPYP